MLFASAIVRNWRFGTLEGDEDLEYTEQACSAFLFAFSVVGIYGYIQGEPYANVMYWRALLVGVGVHFFLICTIYREVTEPVRMDFAQYVRIAARAALSAVGVYLLLKAFGFELAIPVSK